MVFVFCNHPWNLTHEGEHPCEALTNHHKLLKFNWLLGLPSLTRQLWPQLITIFLNLTWTLETARDDLRLCISHEGILVNTSICISRPIPIANYQTFCVEGEYHIAGDVDKQVVMKAVRQSFQKQGLDSVILAEKGAMSLWGLPSEWRGTLEAPSTPPDWYRSSVLVPNNCQYFLPSETMCTLGTLEPGINLFPYPKHGDLHLKGCRMRLACTWGNITNRSITQITELFSLNLYMYTSHHCPLENLVFRYT